MSPLIKVFSLDRVGSTNSSLVKLVQMEEFKVSVRRSTISYTRDSLRMIFIMATEDTFIQMVTTIWAIGSTANGLAGENQSTSLAKFMKECGSTVNSQEADHKIEYVQTYMWNICKDTYGVFKAFKPFNPLLGETFELVTSDFRYYSEMVSHHPPILCVNGQGKNYEMSFTGECIIKFTGKKIVCMD